MPHRINARKQIEVPEPARFLPFRRGLTREEIDQQRRTYADFLLDLRQEYWLSQIRLCELAGISRRTLQMLEGGQATANFSTQRRIQKVALALRREQAKEEREEVA